MTTRTMTRRAAAGVSAEGNGARTRTTMTEPHGADPTDAASFAIGPLGGIWSELIGQDRAVPRLHAAAQAARAVLAGQEGAAVSAMTHAWLFSGPPGSGRSTAARAFAAALQCEVGQTPGCG